MAITFSQLGKMGRLANQLLELGACISHALRTDNSWIFPHWEYEKHFNLHGCFSNNIKSTKVYHEPHFHYAPIPVVQENEILDIVGYMQSWKYLDDRVKWYLTPISDYENIEKTSLHIRRTDYLKFADCHPFPGMNYYEQAMAKSPHQKFIVFSDDIEWCKEHFRGNSFEFSEGLTNVEDMSLMSKCSTNIIANSSFSWFAAYLNNNLNKKVFAPSKWFGPALSHNTKDLYCPDWEVI